MNRVCVSFAVSIVLVAVWSDVSAQATRPSRQYPIEVLLESIELRGASFSPDGTKILVSSYDDAGVFNAFAVPIDGSPPVQLTFSETNSVFSRAYFRNDERLIFEQDNAGNERSHVYVQELDGTVVDITPGEGHKARFLKWAEDGASFFVVSNERDPKYFDLYEVQADGYERELIFENETGYNIEDVSWDKRYVALQKVETHSNSHALLHDRETGETRALLEHEGEAVCSPQAFAKGDEDIFCLTDKDHEFRYLVKESVSGDGMDLVERLDWDVAYAGLSPKGNYLVVAINDDASTDLRIYHASSGRRIHVPEIENGAMVSLAFSQDESAIAFYIESGSTPNDLYYYNLRRGGSPKRLIESLNPRVDPADLVEPEVVRFASYDGVEIPGILYKPYQASASSKAPALVYVHGGPGGQTRLEYSPQIQYLVNHGYVVFGINNRGSSGYGKTFYAMDDLKHGDADLKDCIASKQFLIELGYVDPERIGIMGGSYGGYMVCAAMAFEPDAFAVGVDIFGVTNWVRTLKSIPSWWEATRNALYKELGDPFEQEEYLRKISPLFHAERIKNPMIILQGANDPRVLQIESDEMVAALRENGVPVEYIVFPNEGHGFQKKENKLVGYRAIRKFLDKHLKGIDEPDVLTNVERTTG